MKFRAYYLLRTALTVFCTVNFLVPGRCVLAFHSSSTTITHRQQDGTSIHNNRRLAQVTWLEAVSPVAEGEATTTKSTRWWGLRRLFRKRRTSKEEALDFDSILQTRRTINEFEEDLPDDWKDILEKAILSAIYAPNHKRTEPWRFHLLGKEAIQKVCELNASIVAEKKGEAAGKKKLDRWLLMPGWLVVTCKTTSNNGEEESSSSMDIPASIEREDYAACCCAVQNLCLSLHNAGMGTKWTTGPVNFDARFGEIVGLDKSEYVVGTIWFGTPKQQPNAPPKKQKLEDVLIQHS